MLGIANVKTSLVFSLEWRVWLGARRDRSVVFQQSWEPDPGLCSRPRNDDFLFGAVESSRRIKLSWKETLLF